MIKYNILEYKKIALMLLCIVVSFMACKKVPDGFISNYLRYEEDPIIIIKGRTKVSNALNFDGSSKPVKITMLHIYDKATGKNVDDIFTKKYTIKGWRSEYNAQTDTTSALVAAKQFDLEVTPIVINEVSGQVEANYTTKYIPDGDYEFDLQMTNTAGTKVYPKIGQLQIMDGPPYEADPVLGSPNNRMIKVGDESDIVLAEAPIVTVNKTADEPSKIIFKFVDKNGVAFNPKAGEILHRPLAGNSGGFWQNLEEYAYQTVMYDDRMEIFYVTTPFPLSPRGPGYNFYYRLPVSTFLMDDQVKFPDGSRNSTPRFVLKLYSQGTYEVEIKMPDMVHR
jgi:hypothetical protein